MEKVNGERSTFLTILCVLSFLGIALALVSEIMTWFAIQHELAALKALEESVAIGLRPEIIDRKTAVLIGIATLPVCLIGVILMWTLRKIGFYIYTIGEFALPISIVFLLGFSGPIPQTVMLIINLIFSTAFVVMYGLNLKQMT